MQQLIDRLRPRTAPTSQRWLGLLGVLGLSGFRSPLGFLFFGFFLFFLQPRPSMNESTEPTATDTNGNE